MLIYFISEPFHSKIINTYMKAFKFKLTPNNTQKELLAQMGGASRFVWNHMLELNINTYKAKKQFVFAVGMSNTLPKLKKDNEFLKDVPAQTLQQKCIDLNNALSSVYKLGRSFPKFKSKKHNNDSFRMPQTNGHIKPTKKQIKIPKIGWMKWKMHRPLEGKLKNITIKQENNQWYVICLCDIGDSPNVKSCTSNEVVGIDLGLKDLAITSEGGVYDTPKFYRKKTAKLRRAQRTLARRKKGSKNREKAKKQVNKIHLGIKNQRKDYLHKISTQITNEYLYVAIEDLNVKGMSKNKRLSKSIMDQGWTMFTSMLKYKSIWNGGNTIKIDRFAPSTKTCSACGNIQDMPLNIRVYDCKSCNQVIDRDINAAINIKKWGIEKSIKFNRAGTARIHACGVISDGGVAYDTSSYVTSKQEKILATG